jgi:chlorite dismutase
MTDNTIVQFLVLRIDDAWRRSPQQKRNQGRRSFIESVKHSNITTYAYSLTGLKSGHDLLLMRTSTSLEQLQEGVVSILNSKLGIYMNVSNIFLGLIRSSTYSRRPTTQEQAILEPERRKYLVVYPFTKTSDWYLLSQETRQGIMNEHIRVGHKHPSIRQILAYSFGMDDYEFIVAYETDDIREFQDLVVDLRSTESRRYTLKDTPIFLGVHRTLEQAVDLIA